MCLICLYYYSIGAFVSWTGLSGLCYYFVSNEYKHAVVYTYGGATVLGLFALRQFIENARRNVNTYHHVTHKRKQSV